MPTHKPQVQGFFDSATNTISYVIADLDSGQCAIIDSVLDFDMAAGRTNTHCADQLIDYLGKEGLSLQWIIDTHVHADHIRAAFYLKQQLGGKTAISKRVGETQKVFAELFGEGQSFSTDGSQFDYLFDDDEEYKIGELNAVAMHTPGHTPACMSHLIGDAIFVGDTLFVPDYGTARCDFPGGDARQLYRSIQKIFSLADETRVFLCHDYMPEGRNEFVWETTISAQRDENIHLQNGVDEDCFVKMRLSRDKGLSVPTLILPSVQINIRAGELPNAQSNGKRYLKIPLNSLP